MQVMFRRRHAYVVQKTVQGMAKIPAIMEWSMQAKRSLGVVST